MIRFTADAETVRAGNFFPKLKISLISRLRIPKNFVRIPGIGLCGKAKRNANKVKKPNFQSEYGCRSREECLEILEAFMQTE